MAYETVIGLEVHAQLSTQSKIFCASSAAFGAAPNAHTCTVDLGLPGVLPVLNREVVEFTLRLGLAVGAEVAPACRFARKHYFYPDLPKGYQISQYEEPICRGGEVHLLTKNGAGRVVRLTRIHMEEDAGKLIHGEELGDPQHSYVDFNRAGVPLLEIVTEPDLRSPEEAEAFLRKLRTLVRYLGICDGNMQEGSLRCDAALEYEEVRQRQALDAGRPIEQETRLWNDAQGATLAMRSKEYAHDYRYFPDPDLVPLAVGREWLDKVRAQLPELPDAKRERFQREYGLPPYDAEVLTEERALADYYESVVNITGRDRAKPA
ncbi:MAG: aspartyl/glutamyl-tRNA amidotransferase subunit B, partial [Candidatus Tectomicrobia bacterium]|nr:aspartyl/glutamyl-tRNA amidotransferase subunit B [Candidatus Tectomicrobia bacterium]